MLSRHDFHPFGTEINAQSSDALLIDGFESGDLTAWGDGPDELAVKYTGHERDLHRLSDYMRGRTCLYPLRRFASPDPGRDGWNLYAYTLNNPVRYVDPNGDIAETAWDAFSLGLGLASLAKNVREGNVGGALLDGAGVVLDGLAAATPFVPGGAGAAIKAGRAADAAVDAGQTVAKGRVFTSPDPLVGDLATKIDAANPGHVVGVNVPIRDASGQLVTDADILLTNGVIQVKSGGGKGLSSQLQRTEEATGLPTIGYGPDLKPSILRGCTATNCEQTLLKVIEP